MKIGIYNRYLGTLGGGERYMATIAANLAKVADVDIISQAAIPAEMIQTRLGVDVSAARFVMLDDPSVETAEQVSEKYDLFINASHLDPVRSFAPRSVLLVHFPSITEAAVAGGYRRAAYERRTRSALALPTLVDGFGPPEHDGRRRFWWTHGEGRLEIPAICGKPPEVLVPLASLRPEAGPVVRFTSGDETLATVQVPSGSTFRVFAVRPTHRRADQYELTIHSDTFSPPDPNDSRQLGVAVGEITPAGWRGRAYRGLFQKLKPQLAESVYGRRTERTPAYVTTYTAVWTVSRFVRHWTQRSWGVDSSLINPPVDVAGIKSFGVVPKENIILSVGRFFESNHNKKHLEMIQAFRSLVKEGLSGWKLVLVGGVSDEPVHRAYLERVRDAARGLPVEFALEIPYEELRALYARASIYWHATGFGEDEHKDPAAMEHFGISTVEAMAAGSVPVVIRKAGQRETVIHGQSGLHWRDLDELRARTWEVVLKPELRARLADGARARSEAFSEASFERRLLELVDAVSPFTLSPRP